jgi:sulfate transport system permease protein
MASLTNFHHNRLPLGTSVLRWLLVIGGSATIVLMIIMPFAAVFWYALRDGWESYWNYLTMKSTLHSIYLSLLTVAVAVPFNTVFGIAAAWLIARFEFWGKRQLITIIELPLSVSPIVIGLAYLFVFGRQGLLGPKLDEWDWWTIKMVFSVPAILIVTTIVTLPFVFREVLPLMQSQGSDDEVAAITLGASGWTVFRRVTLPNIKWALVYGVCLCMARAMGEYGSVAVVSGSVPNQTNTMPLQIELLSHDPVQTGSFAVATVLTATAALTIIVKTIVEFRENRMRED